MLSTQIKQTLSHSTDIIFTDLIIGADSLAAKNDPSTRKFPAVFVGVDGLVNLRAVGTEILEPLSRGDFSSAATATEAAELIMTGGVWFAAREINTAVSEIVEKILSGDGALIIGDKAIIFDAKGFDKRGITEPGSENVIKGPKDSFIEALRTNTALIRRRINSPNLHIASLQIGTEIKTNAAVVYLSGTAEPEKVAEVTKRLESITEKAIKSTGSIEDCLKDNLLSPFPQVMYTERPDKLCANICEGKIGVLVDGFPVAFVVPAVFNMLFQSSEDYSQNYIHGSYVRLLRYAGGFLSLIVPAFYVAITTFHHEMLPTNLMLAIIKSKQSVSFSTFLEVFWLLIAFEILIEAGIRLPKSIGQAVSIIGGLVVGEAAVSAKLISPAIVVVIAVTGICGFVVSNSDLANSFRLTRVLLLIAAGFAGLYGLSIGVIFLLYYLSSQTTLGEPFMRGYKDGRAAVRDGLLRLPET
ncbi:MAG: spore germination protein [Oscillospiraceae bacterium]|nr:spore germination protein [Oscillospiraceae bacterium]